MKIFFTHSEIGCTPNIFSVLRRKEKAFCEYCSRCIVLEEFEWVQS